MGFCIKFATQCVCGFGIQFYGSKPIKDPKSIPKNKFVTHLMWILVLESTSYEFCVPTQTQTHFFRSLVWDNLLKYINLY